MKKVRYKGNKSNKGEETIKSSSGITLDDYDDNDIKGNDKGDTSVTTASTSTSTTGSGSKLGLTNLKKLGKIIGSRRNVNEPRVSSAASHKSLNFIHGTLNTHRGLSSALTRSLRKDRTRAIGAGQLTSGKSSRFSSLSHRVSCDDIGGDIVDDDAAYDSNTCENNGNITNINGESNVNERNANDSTANNSHAFNHSKEQPVNPSNRARNEGNMSTLDKASSINRWDGFSEGSTGEASCSAIKVDILDTPILEESWEVNQALVNVRNTLLAQEGYFASKKIGANGAADKVAESRSAKDSYDEITGPKTCTEEIFQPEEFKVWNRQTMEFTLPVDNEVDQKLNMNWGEIAVKYAGKGELQNVRIVELTGNDITEVDSRLIRGLDDESCVYQVDMKKLKELRLWNGRELTLPITILKYNLNRIYGATFACDNDSTTKTILQSTWIDVKFKSKSEDRQTKIIIFLKILPFWYYNIPPLRLLDNLQLLVYIHYDPGYSVCTDQVECKLAPPGGQVCWAKQLVYWQLGQVNMDDEMWKGVNKFRIRLVNDSGIPFSVDRIEVKWQCNINPTLNVQCQDENGDWKPVKTINMFKATYHGQVR